MILGISPQMKADVQYVTLVLFELAFKLISAFIKKIADLGFK